MDPLDPAPTSDWADVLRRLEEAATADPSDRSVARSVLEVADRIAVDGAFGPIVAGVRRDELVRWDSFSATFAGVDTSTGAPAMVRALRPDAARDAVLRRHLAREARALASVVPVKAEPEALRLDLRGLPISAVRGEALARPLCTGIVALAAWERAGLGLPGPEPAELRVEAERVHVACLTAVEPGVEAALAALCSTLAHRDDDGPLAVTARAIAAAPSSAGAAGDAVRAAFAEVLTDRRHALASRWRTEGQRSRHERLHAAVSRLQLALPAPRGGGAVGVDLDGRITVVEVRGTAVLWGPHGEPGEVVWDAAGARAAVARRLVRVHAASPPNPSLQARVGGDQERVDAICRWVAAGLKLRTVRLLLEREPDAARS